MSSFGYRSGAARPLSPGNTIVGEIRPSMPRAREAHAISDVHAAGGDYWASGVDLLILRVVHRLRRAGVEMPAARLRPVAEEAVLDAARFVLDWAEAPGADASVRELGVVHAPSGAVAPTAAGGNEGTSR